MTVVNTGVTVDVDIGKNGDFVPVAAYYEMWIKNTATTQGVPVAPYKQSEDAIFFDDVSPVYYPNAVGLVARGHTTFEYTLGHPTQSGLREVDSIFVSYVLGGGFGGITYAPSFVSATRAAFWAFNTIVRDTTPGSIAGPSGIAAGTGSSWRLIPSWDTTGYRYRWFVNGVEQVADTGAILARTFSSPGTYVVRVDQELLDTTFTVVRSIVAMTADMLGPTSVQPGATCQWQVDSPSGGTSPYTFSWIVNSTAIASGEFLDYTVAGESSLHIQLVLTDSAGRSATIVQNVPVTSGAPLCAG